MNNTATVYGRPGCMKCRQTERKLAQLGLTVIGDLIDDYPNKVEEMAANGEMELPLVEAAITWTNPSAPTKPTGAAAKAPNDPI